MQTDTDLWQELRDGVAMPQAANLKRLCGLLDCVIARLPQDQQLRVAGKVIEQMAEIYALRFNLLMEIWEEADPLLEETLPVLDLEALEAWIRQSMSVDLDALVEQPKAKRNHDKQTPNPTDSVLAVVEPEVILQMMEQIEAEESSQMLQQLAGEEDPTRWSDAIANWIRANQCNEPARFKDLCSELPMPWVEIWLGLLLGKFRLEQTGEFYNGEIFIYFSV